MTRPESWSAELEAGYQKYVRGKHAKELTPRDREGWRVAVDRWKHLKALGDGFRDSIFVELGCLRERGYTKELHQRCAPLGARRLDIAAEQLLLAIEVKYGATSTKEAKAQLDKDAQTLKRDGRRVMVWIVQDLAKLPREIRERQREMEARYPGRFLVREASPAARERVTEEIRELLRTKEAAYEQTRITDLQLDLQDIQLERTRNPEYDFAREQEITAELALASERWMQIDQELTEVREQRATRERALDAAVEREQYRRALDQAPHEREILAVAAQELQHAQLAEREAYAQIWQTELQGLARREHAQAVTSRETAERSYLEVEQQVRQKLAAVSTEPVNREQLRDTIEKAARQEKVLQQRTTTELAVLEQHFIEHATREREAGVRQFDPSVQLQRETTAVGIEHSQARFQEIAKSIDREAFLAWSSAGLDESRVRHFERDSHVYTEIARDGKDPVTVRYDSKERELALAVSMAREGHHPTVIANAARASRDNTMPPGFALAAQREHDQRRRGDERTRLLEQQRERGNERER